MLPTYSERDYTFGQAMLSLRTTCGLTQAGLAEFLGVSRRTVVQWEASDSHPKPEHLKTLIALAVEHRAFTIGREEEEIRVFWQAAQQKAPFDETWLAALLRGVQAPSKPLLRGHNLPQQLTPFIDRVSERAYIATLLADTDCRLLSLVGLGGIGKTRLALQAAQECSANFADGVRFVDLVPIHSADLLVFAVGSALNLPFYGETAPAVQLMNFLRDKALLLVLDNFEHVLDGTPLVVDLLANTPHVKLLITSRERLNLHSEWVLPIEGMDYAQNAGNTQGKSPAAVELFVQCAQRIQPSFTLTGNEAAVLRICQLLEGMPLGIELAAAWVRMLPPIVIAEQLMSSINLLDSPLRDVPQRHRNLEAVFDHSWGRMSSAEQSALARLSVFRGGFDLEAAEQVAGASLPVLASLVDKSLVRTDSLGHYDLHELLRHYAAERLAVSGELLNVGERHLTYFLLLARQAEAALTGPEAIAWLDRLELEYGNLRSALAWSLSHKHAEEGLRLAGALGWFWLLRDRWNEGRQWLVTLLAAAADAPAPVRSKALHRVAEIDIYLGDLNQGIALADEALALARATGDTWNTAWSLATLGLLGFGRGADNIGTITQLEEAIALFRTIDDPWGMCLILRRLSLPLRAQGNYERASMLLEEAVTLARRTDGAISLAESLLHLSTTEWERGADLSRVLALAKESLPLFERMRDSRALAVANGWCAMLAVMVGDDTFASSCLEECFARIHDIAHIPQINMHGVVAVGLLVSATLMLRQGRPAQAATVLSAAEAHFDASRVFSFDRRLFDMRLFDARLAEVQAQIDATAFASAWSEGRSMTVEQAMAYVVQNLLA